MSTPLPELPKPTLYAHELLANRGGIWLACADLDVVKRAHDPGETGEEILHLMTADQLRAYGLAVWKAAMEQAADVAKAHAAVPQFSGNYGLGYTDASNIIADTLEGLPLPESDMTQARTEK